MTDFNLDISDLEDGEYAGAIAALDHPYVLDVGRDIAQALIDRVPVEASFEPGDGTRYALVFTPLAAMRQARARRAPMRFHGPEPVEWGRFAVDGLGKQDARGRAGKCLVSRSEGRCYPFDLGDHGYLHPSYVAGKLDAEGASSAVLTYLFRVIKAEVESRRPVAVSS